MKKILSILILVLLVGCASDFFILNIKNNDAIEAYLMSGWGTITKLNDNSLQLGENSIVSLRKFGFTRLNAGFNLEMNNTGATNIYLRTTRYDFNSNKGMQFEIKKDQLNYYENNQLIQSVKRNNYQSDGIALIGIISEGKKLKFSLNCDEIVIKNCSLKNTEYILIETKAQTNLLLSGITIDSTGF